MHIDRSNASEEMQNCSLIWIDFCIVHSASLHSQKRCKSQKPTNQWCELFSFSSLVMLRTAADSYRMKWLYVVSVVLNNEVGVDPAWIIISKILITISQSVLISDLLGRCVACMIEGCSQQVSITLLSLSFPRDIFPKLADSETGNCFKQNYKCTRHSAENNFSNCKSNADVFRPFFSMSTDCI